MFKNKVLHANRRIILGPAPGIARGSSAKRPGDGAQKWAHMGSRTNRNCPLQSEEFPHGASGCQHPGFTMSVFSHFQSVPHQLAGSTCVRGRRWENELWKKGSWVLLLPNLCHSASVCPADPLSASVRDTGSQSQNYPQGLGVTT